MSKLLSNGQYVQRPPQYYMSNLSFSITVWVNARHTPWGLLRV